MNRCRALLMLAIVSMPAHAADPSPSLDADRAAAKELAFELKQALSAALKVSPENAVMICNDRAPQIAQAVAAKFALNNETIIGRTALRVRNPKNSPTDWQRAVLLDFQNRVRSGESLNNLEYSATVTNRGVREQRYMKAIGTEPLCLTCHGANVAPSVRSAIAAKYPDDRATGFEVGDLRGAVYVVRRLGNTP